MKRYLPLAVLSLWCGCVAAQAPPTHGCDTPESKLLDFWVGDWELTYAGPDGKPVKSRNRITKILDGCAVLEEFSGAPLKGHSVSTYDKATKQWRQTWVDNTSAYLDFTGAMEGGNMVFSREAERQGRKVRQRMVFRDVRADSLTWLWQGSQDDGKTWTTQWEIAYRRSK